MSDSHINIIVSRLMVVSAIESLIERCLVEEVEIKRVKEQALRE